MSLDLKYFLVHELFQSQCQPREVAKRCPLGADDLEPASRKGLRGHHRPLLSPKLRRTRIHWCGGKVTGRCVGGLCSGPAGFSGAGLFLGGLGSGGCGSGLLPHLENGISLNLQCSFQTFNKPIKSPHLTPLLLSPLPRFLNRP